MSLRNEGAEVSVVVDASGLNCPLPVLKAKKALLGIASGECLHLISTDRDTVRDLEAFSKKFGHQLVEWSENEGQLEFLIRKG